MSNKLFEDLKTTELEKTEDRLGGFSVFEADLYTGKVKAMYVGTAKSGAMSMNVVVDLGNNKEYREEIYITKKPTDEQKKANKPGDNFFVKDGKKQPLPGFTTINDFCLITTEKELSELDTEEKIIKLYDYDAKKEVPTAVQMVTEALDKPVMLGIKKILEFKQKKNDSTGVYEDTDETREKNEIDKVFHPEYKVTIAEAREQKPAEFHEAWVKKHKGQVQDKTGSSKGSKSSGGSGKAAGAPPSAGGGKPKTSLFGPKS